MGIWTEAISALIPERKSAIAATIPTWQQGSSNQFAKQGYATLAGQGYMIDEVVFACVEAIATSASEPRMSLYRKGSPDEKLDAITDHPALQLLAHPNEFMDGVTMWAAVMTCLMIGGNAYLEKVRSAAGKVVELWILRPDRMRIIPDSKRFIGGYRYEIGDFKHTFAPEDVIHFKTRHPLDDYYGLPPLAVLAGRVDLDVLSRQFTAAFFHNAGVPSGLLNLQQSVTDQERALIRQRFRQDYGGGNAYNLLVIDANQATYTKMGMAANEGNATDALDQANEARMCMVYGVPPSLISTRIGMASSSYANRKSDRELFWQGRLAPDYRYLGGRLTTGMQDDFADVDRFEFDMSTVQALQEDQDALVTRYLALLEKGAITREECRMKVGMPEEPESPGTYLVPIRSVPTPSDMALEAPQAGLTPRQQAQADALAASGAQAGLPAGEPPAKALTNGRTNGHRDT